MDKQINWEAMRIRIEFLYRIMNWNNVIGQRAMGLKAFELERINSLVATAVLQIAYTHRVDGQWTDSEQERNNATAISQVIAHEYMLISDNIMIECAGLPITILYIKQEGILQEGIDRIMKTVKELIEGKEVAHG